MKQITVLTLLLAMLLLMGCKNERDGEGRSGSYYTCPMHPTVVSSSPGSCPVCNMSLIKVDETSGQHAGMEGNFITIDKRRQDLAGIEMDTITIRNISSASTIVGTVSIDEEETKAISSRAKGRIDKLFVKATGVYLKRGSPLYSIYSEQLQADEKEYLSLLEKSGSAGTSLAGELLSSARNKLRLWGLTEGQISDLESSGNASSLVTFYSAEAGYVSEVQITEGMYVKEGTPILKIILLGRVWIEAQVYSNEVEKVAGNNDFDVFSESNPDEIYNGTLVYNNPEILEGKRIHLLRISVSNSSGTLIPGMPVYVSPKKSTRQVLAVPKSAVLLQKTKTVWVLAHENTFEQRMVETGAENNYWIEITSGLKPGDVLVTDGAYLISSEFILRRGANQTHVH
jgi:Cu(I)/Ag(I) efflux system membrane fusion protein